MNYMKQIAEMLELEWDDKKQESEFFKIDGYDSTYYITSEGLFYKDNYSQIFNSEVLEDLLSGRNQIKKMPWKPISRELYHYADITALYKHYTTAWMDADVDIIRYKYGLVFKTREEAIARAEEILKLMNN